MTGPSFKNIAVCLFCMIMLACAKYTAPPTGGPDDETPPSLVTENSDANYQTNFKQRKISLLFDEWITLSNASNEVVISPPTLKPLIFNQRGKGVTIEFAEDEILKENATYQINFGNAIKDFSVGNVFENFVFVFSTGPVIDSLSVSGKVIDELSGEPVRDMLVMLYENLSDSVLIQERPFYFTKTLEGGRFELNNLRSDTFQIFALKDENVSYTYDIPEELVAFYDRYIITADTINNEIILKAFDEPDMPVFISREHETKGLVKLLYTNQPVNPEIEFIEKDSVIYFDEFVGDTLFIWYRNTSLDMATMVVTHDAGIDTILVKKSRSIFKDQLLDLENIRSNRISIYEGDSLNLVFNRPVLSVDTSLFQWVDTMGTSAVGDVIFTERRIQINVESDSISTKQLVILPGGVTDWYNISNTDTIALDLNIMPASDLGKIQLNISGTDSLAYIFELSKGNEIIEVNKLSSDGPLVYERMVPGQYKLKIIIDQNLDGVWTAGKLIGKIKSEPIKEITLDELKKGWELSLDVDLKQIFDGTEID